MDSPFCPRCSPESWPAGADIADLIMTGGGALGARKGYAIGFNGVEIAAVAAHAGEDGWALLPVPSDGRFLRCPACRLLLLQVRRGRVAYVRQLPDERARDRWVAL